MNADDAGQVWALAAEAWQATPTEAHWSLAVLAAVLVVHARTRKPEPAPVARGRQRQETAEIARQDNARLLRRLWWRARPPYDLMRVDGLEIARVGQTSHMLWIGPTGRGKSASVATVRCDRKRAVFAAMPDLSDPLRAHADFVWTAGESSTPVDFLLGTPSRVAMMLTEVFRSGGNGVWKRGAFLATKRVIEQMDGEKDPRGLGRIAERLDAAIARDGTLKRMVEGWVTRFAATAEALGDSAGPGGVDLAQYLRRGQMVVIDNDAWQHPGLKGDVVAFGLAEARRLADVVPGGFRLIFEEADQLGDRIDLADPFFVAGRRRRVAVDALVHSEDKLPDAMATNSATRAYFRPNKPEHRQRVARSLDMTEREVDGIPDYHAWVEHDGKIRRLVHFPKPRPGRVPATVIKPVGVADTGNGEERRIQRYEWTMVEPADTWEEPGGNGQRALPAPSVTLEKLTRNIYPERGCERWGGKHDKAGHRGKGCGAGCQIQEHLDNCYGLVWIDGGWVSVHRLRWELAFGPIGLNPDGTKKTLDHKRECPRDCSKLEHLEVTTRAENTARSWRVGGHRKPRGSGVGQ